MWNEEAEKLFKGWDASMLHAYFDCERGRITADDEACVTAAMIDIGDFCFLAGQPSQRLLARISGFKLLTARDESWEMLIESFYGSRARKFTRYAIKKEPHAFDVEKLTSYADALSPSYELRLFDQTLFKMALEEAWSCDLVSQFSGYEDYEKHGVGVGILYHGQLVAGASPYAIYSDGIEIEIDTKPEFRQKGLATACGAALILECLERGLYPGWDAHDMRSLALAKKLGYHLDYEYTAYEILV